MDKEEKQSEHIIVNVCARRRVEEGQTTGELQRLRMLAERLTELGITTVGQLAALDAAEAEALDARLGPFTGRMKRDRWIEQARFLAAGDRAGFEAAFGKL